MVMQRDHWGIIILFALIALGGVWSFTAILPATPLFPTNQPLTAATQLANAPLQEPQGFDPLIPVDELPLQARGVAVLDVATGKLLGGIRPTSTFPLASLTKLFTALAAVEAPYPQSFVTVLLSASSSPSRAAFIGGTGVSRGQGNEQAPSQRITIPFSIALALLLSASSNEAAEAIAQGFWYSKRGDAAARRAMFLKAINMLAQSLHLSSVSIQSPSGLDFEDKYPSALGSPLDIARLVRYLFLRYPQIAKATLHPSVTVTLPDGEVVTFSNTNPTAIRDTRIRFSKTGFTNSAGGNLAVVVEFDPQHRAVVVVMGSTFAGRFRDVVLLLDHLSSAFRSGKW